MNYDTYLDKLYDMATTIEDLRHQLKQEKEANKPMESLDGWNFYESVKDILKEDKLGSYEDKDGNDMATMDDLISIIEDITTAYEDMQDEYKAYVNGKEHPENYI